MSVPMKLNISPLSREVIIDRTPGAIPYVSLKDIPENVRNTIRVSSASLYSDNIWDMSDEYSELRPNEVCLKFKVISFEDGSSITDPQHITYLALAKEYYYTLLVDPPASRPKWSTCCATTKGGIKYLFRYMRAQNVDKLSDLNSLDFEGFHEWVINIPHAYGKDITDRTLGVRVMRLSWLYEQSNKLCDGLKVWPFGDSHTEKEWCRRWAKKVVARNNKGTPEIPDEVAVKLIKSAINDLAIADKLVDLKTRLATHDIQRKHMKNPKSQGGDTYRILNPFPWHEYGIRDGRSIKTLQSRLTAACYILISIFTGMRVHEVLNIKHDKKNNWRVEDIEIDGGIKKLYFVVTTTTKLEAVSTEYMWQTIPLVEDAIDALESALKHRYEDGNPYLFASYCNTKQPLHRNSLNRILNEFVAHHQITYKGKLWHLTSHQFRKTFSRIMIRQGLGIKALQDQLKHYDIEMTKDYGDINLYSELQQEKFLLSEELYEEFLGSQVPIIGGGAAEIMAYRKQFQGMAKEDRKKFLHSLSKKALLEQTDDGLCIYRANKALCGGDKRNCRRADCNNSFLPAEGYKRTLLWRKQENLRMITFFKGQPLKVAHLNHRIEEIDKLLAQINAEGTSKGDD